MSAAKIDIDEWMNDSRLSKPRFGLGQMERVALRLLLEHYNDGQIPTNGRFLFYEAEQRSYVRKSKPEDGKSTYATNTQIASGDLPREQNLTNGHSSLRKKGIIPWSWMVDETRDLYVFQHAITIFNFVRNAVEYARINPWPGEPPLIICESRSLAGVLYPLAQDYLCDIASTNGQCGGFLHTDLVPALADNDRIVLYLGDWDISGHQIENNTRSVLEKETGRWIDWTRIAITQEQIDERGIEPVWKKDGRYHPAKTHFAYETEALGQGEITRLVREPLDDLLLPVRLEDVKERERVQRVLMRKRFGRMTDPADQPEDEWPFKGQS
jgi:hypothetical protein